MTPINLVCTMDLIGHKSSFHKELFSRLLWRTAFKGVRRQGFRLVVCLLFLCGWTSVTQAKPLISNEKLKILPMPRKSLALPRTNIGCWKYVSNHWKIKPKKTPQYPTTVDGAVRWIQKAQREGRIYWQRAMILGKLQLVIDRHKKGNLYLLFGNDHTVTQHYQFFNELLHPGRDQIQLDGITHISLEAYLTHPFPKKLKSKTIRWLSKVWGSAKNRRLMLRSHAARAKLASLVLSDQQPFIDLYIHKGKKWSYRLLEILTTFLLSRSYPAAFLHEVLATLKHARQRKKPIDVIASDISSQIHYRIRRLPCWLYPLREIYSLKGVRRRLRKKRNVVAFMWGADHIRKRHIFRFLRSNEKGYAVRMQGGGMPDIWDRALYKLRLPQKMFAIRTPGAEDGDLMVHFPPVGSWLAGNAHITQIAMAKISRRSKGSALPIISKAPWLASYQTSVRHSLSLMGSKMARCYHSGRRSALIQIRVGMMGRVQGVTLLGKNNKKNKWSETCLQKVLWRLPLSPPPRRRAMLILFRAQYQPTAKVR